MQIISKIREIDAKSKGLDNPNTSAGELAKSLFFSFCTENRSKIPHFFSRIGTLQECFFCLIIDKH